MVQAEIMHESEVWREFHPAWILSAEGLQVQVSNYTADAICRSMGLDGFEPASTPCIRVLLKPSFHPEVCITLGDATDAPGALLSVVALTERLWPQLIPRRLFDLREDVCLPPEMFAVAAARFAAAFADRNLQGHRVTL
ncbi:MAG: hypothetical protein ACRCZF_15965, partial [Gemmataceae bacterium]